MKTKAPLFIFTFLFVTPKGAIKGFARKITLLRALRIYRELGGKHFVLNFENFKDSSSSPGWLLRHHDQRMRKMATLLNQQHIPDMKEYAFYATG